jgi:hypothetical protein
MTEIQLYYIQFYYLCSLTDAFGSSDYKVSNNRFIKPTVT